MIARHDDEYCYNNIFTIGSQSINHNCLKWPITGLPQSHKRPLSKVGFVCLQSVLITMVNRNMEGIDSADDT